MDKKTLTIGLAVALIASFFLPFVGNGTALDVVQGSFLGWEKYVLLLIPLTGLLLLIGALNNGNYPLGRNFLAWLPLVAVLFWVIGVPLVNGVSIGNIFNGFTRNAKVGFWIAAIASLLLAFYKPRV